MRKLNYPLIVALGLCAAFWYAVIRVVASWF